MDREKQVRDQIKDLQEQLERERVRKITGDNAQTAAEALRQNYDAFVDVGFTEGQAYELLLETLRMNRK